MRICACSRRTGCKGDDEEIDWLVEKVRSRSRPVRHLSRVKTRDKLYFHYA
jgi:hypothetical protein